MQQKVREVICNHLALVEGGVLREADTMMNVPSPISAALQVTPNRWSALLFNKSMFIRWRVFGVSFETIYQEEKLIHRKPIRLVG